jgi:hypothetical protein
VNLVRENNIDVDVNIILKSTWTDTQINKSCFFWDLLPKSFYFFLSLSDKKKKIYVCDTPSIFTEKKVFGSDT